MVSVHLQIKTCYRIRSILSLYIVHLANVLIWFSVCFRLRLNCWKVLASSVSINILVAHCFKCDLLDTSSVVILKDILRIQLQQLWCTSSPLINKSSVKCIKYLFILQNCLLGECIKHSESAIPVLQQFPVILSPTVNRVLSFCLFPWDYTTVRDIVSLVPVLIHQNVLSGTT